jgi:hypothetical protein
LQNTALSLGAADLIWLAFFFLLRPGEYTITGKSPHPFTLADVRLWHNDTPIDPLTASPDLLLSATFSSQIKRMQFAAKLWAMDAPATHKHVPS